MATLQLSKGTTILTELSESLTEKFDMEHEDSSYRFSKQVKSEPAEENVEIFEEELFIKEENVKVERVTDDEINKIDRFKEQIQQLMTQIQPQAFPDSDNVKEEKQEHEDNLFSESCEIKSEFGIPVGNTAPKRNYPKKREFCMFCKSLITNICRHFQTIHKDVHEVKEFEKLRKGTVERAKLIANLRNTGNFEYNFETKNRKSDQLILVRNKHKVDSENYNGNQYIPCLNCKATYSKSCIARHYDRCYKNPVNDTNGQTLMKIPSFANDVLRKEVLPHMNQDAIFRILINDKVIILFGNHLTKKGLECRSVTRKLRFLARYFQVIKKKCPNIAELGQLFQVKYFDLAMDGIRDLSGRSHEMLRILKVCCNEVQLEYKRSDFEMAKSAARFGERLSALSGFKRKEATKSVTVSKRTWSDLERQVAQNCFQAYIDARKMPPVQICRDAIEENPALKNRSVDKVRSWIQNQIKNSVSDQTNKRKVYWTLVEKAKVRQLFGEHIVNGTYPSLKEIELATKQPELRNRSVEKIRSFLQHQMKQRRVS